MLYNVVNIKGPRMGGSIQASVILAKKRARIIGEIRQLQVRISKDQGRLEMLLKQLNAINTTVGIMSEGLRFDPDAYKPVRPTPRRALFGKHGVMSKAALTVLRLAKEPLATTQVLDGAAAHTGVVFNGPDERARYRRCFGTLLRALERRGLVRRVDVPKVKGDDPLYWELVR